MRLFTGSRCKSFVKGLILLTAICSLAGCASLISKPPQVVLLPEERIFTVPGGQKIAVTLDKKPMEMTFPNDMKLVSPTVLVRQEEKLNNEMLKNVKASQDNAKKLGIVGSILTILGIILGAIFRKKIWPTISAKVDMK